MNDKVSIVTPVFNSEKFIEETIKSILSQSYESWELILIDDCSTDSSLSIINEYAKEDERIRVLSLSCNSGAAVARNKGIEDSNGNYIAFLDSDDIWYPEKLERQIAFMKEKKAVFSFAAYRKVDEAGNTIGSVGVPETIDYNGLLKTNVIGCFTAMYDTHQLGKVYMPLIRKRQDYGLWLSLLKKVKYAYGLNETLGEYRVREGSISSGKVNASLYNWTLYRKIERLSLLKSAYCFMHYFVRGVLRSKHPTLAKMLGVLH